MHDTKYYSKQIKKKTKYYFLHAMGFILHWTARQNVTDFTAVAMKAEFDAILLLHSWLFTNLTTIS